MPKKFNDEDPRNKLAKAYIDKIQSDLTKSIQGNRSKPTKIRHHSEIQPVNPKPETSILKIFSIISFAVVLALGIFIFKDLNSIGSRAKRECRDYIYNYVTPTLRDPNSYEEVSSEAFISKDDKTLSVYIVYTARNGFGGRNKNSTDCIWEATPDKKNWVPKGNILLNSL
jgi:hypothetical protein